MTLLYNGSGSTIYPIKTFRTYNVGPNYLGSVTTADGQKKKTPQTSLEVFVWIDLIVPSVCLLLCHEEGQESPHCNGERQ